MNKLQLFKVLFLILLLAACSGKKDARPLALNKDQQRFVALQGAYNVRDLGGYKAAGDHPTHLGVGGYDDADVKTVRWYLVYRSDDLSNLQPDDIKELERRSIKTVIDFRAPRERDAAKDRLPATVQRYVTLPIVGEKLLALDDPLQYNTKTLMREAYRGMVYDAQPEFRRFFQLLEAPSNAPVLFHCSAGKDRTGVAAALFLSALGVDRETILRDYMLSSTYLTGKYDQILIDKPRWAEATTVHRDYLEAAFNEIDRSFGGMDNYLRHLGVNTQRLKQIYLE